MCKQEPLSASDQREAGTEGTEGNQDSMTCDSHSAITNYRQCLGGNSLLGRINSQIHDDIYVFDSEYDLLFEEKKTLKIYVCVYIYIKVSHFTSRENFLA